MNLFTDVVLLPAGSAPGSSAGIVFTHGPILRFFAPQGRHVASPLLHAKFPHDRFRGGGLLKKIPILQI